MLIRDLIGLLVVWIIVGLGELYKKENIIQFKKTGRIIFETDSSR